MTILDKAAIYRAVSQTPAKVTDRWATKDEPKKKPKPRRTPGRLGAKRK